MGEKRDEWVAGYVCATADILRNHDEPTIAKDVLGAIGIEAAKAHGDPYDLAFLRKAGLLKKIKRPSTQGPTP